MQAPSDRRITPFFFINWYIFYNSAFALNPQKYPAPVVKGELACIPTNEYWSHHVLAGVADIVPAVAITHIVFAAPLALIVSVGVVRI